MNKNIVSGVDEGVSKDCGKAQLKDVRKMSKKGVSSCSPLHISIPTARKCTTSDAFHSEQYLVNWKCEEQFNFKLEANF